MKMGLSMTGMEEAISGLVRTTRNTFQPCTYVEIGVARGETLVSVAKVLRETKGDGWRAVGVELPNGYSYEPAQVEQNATGQHFNVAFVKPQGWNRIDPTWNQPTVILCDVRDFFEGIWDQPIHLALIDACHCKECVIRDFQNVEKYVPVGGSVMLHDYEKRINASQPHGGHCDVVGGCEELGLNQGTRKGWSSPCVFVADQSKDGANMLVVQRISV